MRSLTTDFQKAHLRPYFLWDEDVSIDEFRERLLAKGRRAGELAREQNVPGRIDRDTSRLVVQSSTRRDRPLKRRRSLWFFSHRVRNSYRTQAGQQHQTDCE